MQNNQLEIRRLRVSIHGAVQGVGFRPFVYRLADELGLQGWVVNSASGVVAEVEGTPALLREFHVRVERDRPPRAVIHGMEASWLDPAGFTSFEIRPSQDGSKRTLILPDIAPCADCLREMLDEADRRFRYPFTNCTNCGPRFTIIEQLPYDRPATTMARFRMCERCESEYLDPRDRRFHAQPNACPACGPRLQLWDAHGRPVEEGDDALRAAERAIAEGRTVALKGVGGFHLLVDARDAESVGRLRLAKNREEKPFAVMVPSLEAARLECQVDDLEARLLASPEAPIVLLARRPGGSVCADVAPGNPTLGLMLPSTPLHHLLLGDLSHAVVATSGNRSDEPICTDEHEALARLDGLADLFLVHDRPIARHVDDSVVRVVLGRELVLRRARGLAPMPVRLPRPSPPLLAVGAHLKNTVALAVGDQVFLSQHIGDLETREAYAAFEQVIGAFEQMYEVTPELVACDAHPDYMSTAYARGSGAPVFHVQHHVAHVLSCMAENEIEPPLLGVAWDGTGYGSDGSIWGGEFFEVTAADVHRVATFRQFGLPGGDKAVREPGRSAASVLFALMGPAAFDAIDLAPVSSMSAAERSLLCQMLANGVNSPMTSSAGRLFDAVSSLLGIRQHSRYEGQAAMELEWAALAGEPGPPYPFDIVGSNSGPAVFDWGPMVRAIVAEVLAGGETRGIARRFHDTLAQVVVAVAKRHNLKAVVLSGGCFQNRYLTEQVVERLREERFRPYWHQRVPPNDGGIALGQVVAAQRQMQMK